MTITVGVKHKRAVAAARIASIDSGVGDSTLTLYGGARIGILDAPPAAVVEVILARPCGVVTDTGVHLYISLTAQVLTNATITWGRIRDGDGIAEMDVDVRMLGAADVAIADIIIDEAMVYAGGFITLAPSNMNEAG